MSDKILSEKFLSKYKNKQPKWGFNGLGYIVYKRTYARTKPDGTTEEWWETLERCIEGAQKIGAKYTVEEAEELYDAMFNLECSFSGRSLWQLGTALVDEGYMDSLLNCFAGETLVLTRQGWKRIDSLSGASHEIVTENGKWVKSHFKCFGQQRLKKITLKEQYGKNNQTIYATDNHEWLVITNKGRIRKTTKELQNGDQLPIILGKNSSQYLSPQGIQHGLVYGDGSCDKYESTIDLIDNTYLYCNKYFSNNRSNIIKDNHVRYGGLPNYYKSLPNINENKPYLMGFLAGWIAADGNVNSRTGTIRLFNKDKNVLLMAKDIASVCGFRTTEPYFESDINPFNGEKRTLWSISFYLCDKSEILIIRDDHKSNLKINTKKRHCDYVKVINIEDTNRTENVYCCVVPDTHSFVIQGNILTGNCWGSKVSTIDDFYFIVLESMMGGGVGNNISREYTQELPRVKENVKCICKKTNDADFIVPDSKEGWCELFKRVLQAYLETGRSFSWSPICIRKEGEPLKRFGGIAPGDKPLIEGISLLCGVLNNRQGKKLRTQDVADIICIGGEIMKSGGIRRTALILGGDVDDTAYLLLKRWDLCNIPYYRSNSNNSLLTSKFEYLSSKFWDGFSGNGEAYGLLNLFLARKYGRIGETEFDGFSLFDPHVIIFNPCAESTLCDKEPCNLAEHMINIVPSKEKMLRNAILLYKTQKAICHGEYLFADTNKIVHKNYKIGQSITGICQRLDVIEDWADYVYRGLRKFDKEWSKKNNIPQSKRLTVIQPSGTKSLLSGSMPGGHPGYSKYHIRRVRFSSNDKLIPLLRKCNYPIEPEIRIDGSTNHNMLVVSFPCKFDGGIFAEEFGAIAQMDLVKKLQTCWADQSVSVTIYYKEEELEDIKKWLADNYDSSVKSMSFLRHSNHNFPQAPYEQIDEKTYMNIVSKLKNIDQFNINNGDILSDISCVGGHCPVR